MRTRTAVSLSILLSVVTSVPALGQGFYLGGRGGFGNTSYTLKEGQQQVDNVEAQSGVMAGLLAGYQFAGMFSAEVDLMFARKGFTVGGDEGDIYRFDYFQVPVLARATFTEDNVVNPRAFAGPIFGFETRCQWTPAGQLDSEGCPFATNSTEIGILVGGGITIGAPIQFTVDVIFDFGLTNVRSGDATEASYKSRRLGFLFGIEYSFWDRSEF